MLVAHHLAARILPRYTCKCSRHDFTLPQLFACLCCKELLGRTYRGAEAVLRDADHWCHAIGMSKVPDHNTLCNAAARLLKFRNVASLLDQVARWAEQARALGLSIKPFAGDSTHFETRHVSRHYERRCAKARRNLRKRAVKRRCRARTVKRLPKLAVGVTCASHLIVSTWVGTGAGSDSPHFERLLFDAWRRVPHKRFTAVFDAGYDGEHNHALARREMGLKSIIPPRIGRPTDTPPPPRSWRGRMRRLLATRRSRQRCGYTQRWQAETVVSMIKRNLGDELRGKTARSRKRDMLLKVITHDLMIIRRQSKGRDRAFLTPFTISQHGPGRRGPASARRAGRG